jgi:hypothetical protein
MLPDLGGNADWSVALPVNREVALGCAVSAPLRNLVTLTIAPKRARRGNALLERE